MLQVEETDKVIAEIETVSQQYLPLSQVRALRKHNSLIPLLSSLTQLYYSLTGMQQHLLHNGVSEPSALPLPVLSEDVPGHIQFGSGVQTAERSYRPHG